MGNAFGNYSTREAAEQAILADGFELRDSGLFAKRSMTGGNLIEPPVMLRFALVEVTACRVDGQWAADGQDYFYYQHHFI